MKNSYSDFCSCNLLNSLVYLSLIYYDVNNFEILHDEHKHLGEKMKVLNKIYLWFLWLSHINYNRIHGFVKSEILSSLDFETMPIYESYLENKMTKSLFKAKGYRTTKPLELLGTNVF